MLPALDVAFVAAIAVAWPLWDHVVEWPRFQRAMASGEAGARLRTYRRAIVLQWIMAAVATAVWWNGGRSLASAGLVAPTGWRLAVAIVAVLAYALLAMQQATRVRASGDVRTRLRGRFEPQPMMAIVPRTPAERGWAVPLAITAGVCEELLFRGILVGILAAVVGPWLAILASAACFGCLHAYQGRTGILRSALVGFAMSLIVVLARSLLPAMALHALVDLGSFAVLGAVFAEPATA